MTRKISAIISLLCCLFAVACAFLIAPKPAGQESFPVSDSWHKKPVIIVDAGHGGEDGGAVSCTGAYESHINLQIALRLCDLLRLLGHDCRLTRTTDTALHTEGDTIAQRKASDLRNRVKLINSTPNAVLVSIHQNNFPDSRYSGAQVFYRDADSKLLAETIQAVINSSLCVGSRRLSQRSKGVYLMEHVSAPAVLVECGFLSNTLEEAKLRTPQYQKKLSCVIAASLCVYLDRSTLD